MEQAFNELPHQTDAEKSVIGALLKSPEAVMLAQETLKEDDFFDPALRELFGAIMYLANMSRPVDIVTLS
ncbi:MAG: replicative DNA helicase, partial [Clostridia bacterium]|nr:replicative DNA helicase [Clostridia bacterium]